MIYVLGSYTTSYPDGMFSWPYGPTITPHATNEVYVPSAYGTQDPTYMPPDTTPPKITIHSPTNTTYKKQNITLNFTINETAKAIGYVLDGGAPVEIAGNTTLEGVQPGVHSLTLYAVDAENNKGTSEKIYFTIDEAAEPMPLTLIAAAIAAATTSTTAAYLLQRCRKHNKPKDIKK